MADEAGACEAASASRTDMHTDVAGEGEQAEQASTQAMSDAQNTGEGEEEEEEEPHCRYCFMGADEADKGKLCSPCACSGSQAFVHLQCLQRWQSSTLLAAASNEVGNIQHATCCSVCKTPYTTPLPERSRLLGLVRAGGDELARLLQPGTLLVASPELGDMDLDEMDVPPWLRVFLMKRREHWVRSVYLLIEVHEEEAEDGSDALVGVNLTALRESFGPNHRDDVKRLIAMDGVKLFNGGPCDRLAPYALHNLRAARRAMLVPTLTPDDERPFADEPAAAVSAPAAPAGDEAVADAAEDALGEAEPTAAQAGSVGESGEAATPADGPESAVLFSDSMGLGELARLLEAGLTTPTALGCAEGAPPHVHVFEGHARWSRVQLQNEIARGDWGVVTARPHEALPLPLQPAAVAAAATATSTYDDLDATAALPAVLTPAQLWQHVIDAGRAIFASSPL